MISREIIITNPSGIHAIYAAQIAELVRGFESDVFMRKGHKTTNCRSLISVLGLSARQGDSLTVMVDGTDETAAMETVVAFIKGLTD